MTSTAAWQMQRLNESGMVYKEILAQLASLTGKSDAELRAAFEQAGVKAMRFDDAVYKAAGLNPLPLNLSPAMAQVLAEGLRKTQGAMRNLTMTTAISGQEAFTSAADLAYMQVSSGAMSYSQAIREAIKEVASKGLSTINFANGRHDQLDVAVRRSVLTGVAQTTGMMQIARANEMGCDLVQTTAHGGARPTHQVWQGQVFSRSGRDPAYPPFVESTGYGSVTGLMGANCRHHFFPFFKGISENAYKQATLDDMASKTVTYNGEKMSQYDASQVQRGIERKIRYWKRQAGALEAAGLDNTGEVAQVKAWQAKMRGFVKQTGLKRQAEREQVIKAIPKAIDVDIQKAQQGNLFSLASKNDDVILSKSLDLSDQYKNEQMKTGQVILDQAQKGHIYHDHKNDVNWINQNQEIILKAITNPSYMDIVPRKGEKGALIVANIVPIDNDIFHFLNVAVSFNKNNRKPAQVWTIFRTTREYVFWDNGELKSRWKSVK